MIGLEFALLSTQFLMVLVPSWTGLTSFSRGRKTSLGGLGGLGQPEFFGLALAQSLLAYAKKMTQFITKKLNTQREKNMKNKKQNANNSLQQLLTTKPLITALLLTLVTTASCTTTCKTRNLTIETLDRQNKLIEKIKAERTDETLKQKLAQDADIRGAENHLTEGLHALEESNAAIKEAILKK